MGKMFTIIGIFRKTDILSRSKYILAKYPTSARFPSPSGGVVPSVPRLGHLRRPFAAAFGGGKRKIKKIGAPSAPLLGSPCGAP